MVNATDTKDHVTLGRCAGRLRAESDLLFTVVVKESFRVDGTNLAPDEPEPILEEERLRPGLDGAEVPVRMPDLIPDKLAPDLIVLATVRPASAVSRSEVVLSVAGRERLRLLVSGRRFAEPAGGRSWRFSEPEPFERMPLSWDHAYGGHDLALGAGEDEPFVYPRNYVGRGFLTSAGTAPDMVELPNVERADDLLTPQRLFCRSADRWHRQPRPGGMSWMPGHWFPRSLHFALLLPPPPDLSAGKVPEEEVGLLRAGSVAAAAESGPSDLMQPEFFQEAAPGLTIPGLEAVATLELAGVEATTRLVYKLPRSRPAVSVCVGRRSLRPRSKLFTVLLDLDEGRAFRLWGAPVPLSVPELRDLSEEDLLDLPVDVGWETP